MNNVWEIYERNKIEEPKLKENKGLRKAELSKITANI